VQRPPPFLSYLSDEDARWLRETGVLQRVRKGDVVITQGVRPEHIFMVLEGEFEVDTNLFDGTRVRPVGPGELLGEMSYRWDIEPRNSVLATSDSTLLSVRRVDIDEKCDADLEFRERFLRILDQFIAERIEYFRHPERGYPRRESESEASFRRLRKLIKEMLDENFGDRPPETGK